jgi:CheY-like chemotaxis protein
MFVAAN